MEIIKLSKVPEAAGRTRRPNERAKALVNLDKDHAIKIPIGIVESQKEAARWRAVGIYRGIRLKIYTFNGYMYIMKAD